MRCKFYIQEVALEETEEYENTQRRFKRANQVSELLNADNEDVGKKLVSDEQLLDILMSILKNDEQLNPLLASFFSKIFGGLLKHHPESTWNYLKNKEDLMDDIIKHMQVRILNFQVLKCESVLFIRLWVSWISFFEWLRVLPITNK